MSPLLLRISRTDFRPVLSVAFGLVAVLLLLSSCMLVNYPGGVSGSNTPLDGKSYTVLGQVQDESCVYSVMGFAAGAQRTPAEVGEAAASSKGGDALIDVTYRARVFMWMLMIPVVQQCTIVEGKAIKFST